MKNVITKSSSESVNASSAPNNLRLVGLFAIASLVLAACGGGAAATEPAAGGPKVTESGFECPEPNPRMEVTSTELNIFVWTEYFPQDMLDCFELVYDITLNRDEYSSNEEMYAKLSAGGGSLRPCPAKRLFRRFDDSQ